MNDFKPYSIISPNGYVVNYDTQRRKLYSDEQEQRVMQLHDWCLTLREIAGNTSIPVSSVYNILKRNFKIVSKDKSKPSLSWLSRKDCNTFYDMTDGSFNYIKNAYPQYYLNKGGRVYIHYNYIKLYYLGNKGYDGSRYNSKRDKGK